MTFTDTELNEIELRLRETASILRDKGYCDRNFGIDDKAADAIAFLRKERRPREPTEAMLDASPMATDTWSAQVWRAMYDAAAPEERKDGL